MKKKYPPIGTRDFSETLSLEKLAFFKDLRDQYGDDVVFSRLAMVILHKHDDPVKAGGQMSMSIFGKSENLFTIACSLLNAISTSVMKQSKLDRGEAMAEVCAKMIQQALMHEQKETFSDDFGNASDLLPKHP